MWKRVLAILLTCGMCVFCGCGVGQPQSLSDYSSSETSTDEKVEVSEETVENPFIEESSEVTEVSLGRMSHGVQDYQTDEDGVRYYLYEGGEIKLGHSVSADQQSETGVGFLVFIDGVPQAYSVEVSVRSSLSQSYPVDKDEEEMTKLKYLHTFYVEDNKSIDFNICLTPTVGKAGDTLEVCVVSVLYPDFVPDVSEAATYGIYHSTLEVNYNLVYEVDAPQVEATENNTTNNIVTLISQQISEEELTQEQKEAFQVQWNWSEDDWNLQIHNAVYINSENYTQSYDIGEQETIHLRVEIVGAGGGEFAAILLVDNQPLEIAPGSIPVFEVKDGMISVLEADLDVSGLEGTHNLMILFIPTNALDASDANTEVISHPIALYSSADAE